MICKANYFKSGIILRIKLVKSVSIIGKIIGIAQKQCIITCVMASAQILSMHVVRPTAV